MPEYYDPAEFTKGNETWYDDRLWPETSNTSTSNNVARWKQCVQCSIHASY